MMTEINCPQCNGCLDEYVGCRRECFSYKVAYARAKDKEKQRRAAMRADAIFHSYAGQRRTKYLHELYHKRRKRR